MGILQLVCGHGSVARKGQHSGLHSLGAFSRTDGVSKTDLRSYCLLDSRLLCPNFLACEMVGWCLQDGRFGWHDKQILSPPEHPYFSLEAYSTHNHRSMVKEPPPLHTPLPCMKHPHSWHRCHIRQH